MKKLSYIAFVLILSSTILSCEKDTTISDQERIHPVYILNYNNAENKTVAMVGFYLDSPNSGSQQKHELNYPANIQYNDKSLVFNVNERSYEKEFIGLVQGNFVYTNYHEEQFTNAVSMVEPLSIELLTDSSDSQYDYYFEVNGAQLAPDEVVRVDVNSLNSGVKYGMTFSSLSSLTVQIQASQLQALGNGPTVVKVTRRKDYSAENSTVAGGQMLIEHSFQDTVIIY